MLTVPFLFSCGGGGGGELTFSSPPPPPKDTIPPQLNSHNPSDGATYLDHEITVTLFFNEAIKHGSVNTNTFMIRDSSGKLIKGKYQFSDTLHYPGTRVFFTPSARLNGNEIYYATVTRGITDTSGNNLVSGAEWSFSTGPSGTGQWTQTSIVNAPDPTSQHTAVWTGSEMLVWGGNSFTSTGYRYNPETNTWAVMSNLNAPSPRTGHTAIWTGAEMIIWGGRAQGTTYTWLNDGARYTPVTDTWQALSISDAPEARGSHSAVWTGAQMLIWGGRNGNYIPQYPIAGGIYDPDTDSWQVMSLANAPSGRSGQTGVWTGTHLLIWGGGTQNKYFTTSGGRYEPVSDTWTAMSLQNAPEARSGHTAVWTGSDMVVWGGYADEQQLYATGGRYDPLTDSWATTNTTEAPLARWGHSAVWSDNKMIVWGGNSQVDRSRIGGLYHPGTDTWRYTTTLNAPDGRTDPAAIWTGTEMIVWGGIGGITVNTGGMYVP